MNDLMKTWFNDRQRAHVEILRDLLIEIFKRRPQNLVFKGGTAISFFHGGDRFSEDIDLSSSGRDDYATIDDALESFEDSYNYVITNSWEDEIYQKQGFRRYPLTFRYGVYDNINTSIDYSIGRCLLVPDMHDLSNGHSTAKISVMKEEEIIAEKVRAIYSRQKGRDLYDLYYLCVTRKVRISRSMIAEKLAEDSSLNGIKYSFVQFEKRVAALEQYWGDLRGIVNGFESLRFNDISDRVLNAFKNI
jgi:predicted nucleotidyltransferase component of viral defense system